MMVTGEGSRGLDDFNFAACCRLVTVISIYIVILYLSPLLSNITDGRATECQWYIGGEREMNRVGIIVN